MPGHAAKLVVLFTILAQVACGDPAFDYTTHAPPRVSVIHRPLNPAPDQPITIVARPEAAPGRRVAAVHVTLLRPGGRGTESRMCGPADLTPEGSCVLTTSGLGRAGTAVYGARMTDDAGTEARASSYSFTIGGAPVGERIVALRVPLLVATPQLFRVLLVRDRESYDADAAALRAAEDVLYDGVLDDPVHRWRDAQLAFYYTTRPGTTRDYHSGLQSRCGGRPWAGTRDEAVAEADAEQFFVVGVLHTKDYRDCAGADLVGGQRRFSARGNDAALFQHEFGHALALLSDEYRETTATRQMRADSAARPGQCACCDPDTGSIGPGAPGTRTCPVGVPSCIGFVPPLICHAAPPLCPRLGSGCLDPNVFPSLAACRRAAAEINAHPGVELTADPAACRLLCAGEQCPCVPTGSTDEVWILNRRTPVLPAAPDDDLMGATDPLLPRERHGPACALCLEVTYCMRWETGRGRTEADARAHCTS